MVINHPPKGTQWVGILGDGWRKNGGAMGGNGGKYSPIPIILLLQTVVSLLVDQHCCGLHMHLWSVLVFYLEGLTESLYAISENVQKDLCLSCVVVVLQQSSTHQS